MSKKLILLILTITFAFGLMFADAETEPNNLPTDDGVLTVTNGQHTGTITAEELDFWKFSATTGDQITISTDLGLSETNNTDTQLYLLKRDGNMILARNDDVESGNLQSKIENFEIELSGVYYFIVRCYGTRTGDYTVELSGATELPADAPDTAINRMPADKAIDVALDTMLKWRFGRNTATYDLYFGENELPTTPVVTDGNVTDTLGTYTPSATLNPTSIYYWKVVTKNNGTEIISDTWSFRTITNPVDAFPYTVDFERGITPLGWTESSEDNLAWRYNNGGYGEGTSSSPRYPDAAHGGNFNALLFYGNNFGLTKSATLVSPKLDLSSALGAKLKFWYAMKKLIRVDRFKVEFKLDENADWATLKTYGEADTTDVWVEQTIDIPRVTATSQIRFNATGNTGYGVCIDDITISTLDASSYGNITGVVSANSNPIDGAVLTLKDDATGTELATFTTSTDGAYNFDNLYIGDYTIEALKFGYNIYTSAAITVTGDATINHAITLTDYNGDNLPPQNVSVMQSAIDAALITWEEHEFRMDDGVAERQLGFGRQAPYPANATMGTVFKNEANITGASWFFTGNAPHTQCKVIFLGLTDAGIPDQTRILHQSELVNSADSVWNTYTLATPIAAPNGFYVGVITPGEFLSLGLDDGVGAPYEFEVGTQFGCADITNPSQAWLELSTQNIRKNFMVRASGQNMGEVTFNAPAENNAVSNNVELVYSRLAEPINTNTRGFIGYNIKRDGTQLNTEILRATSYTDTSLAAGDYSYVVSAVYGEVIVDAAPVSVTIGAITGSIEGTITSTHSGNAIANATVRIESALHNDTATTDASGNYSFTNLLADDYTVTVNAAGFAEATANVTVGSIVAGGDVALTLLLTVPANLTATLNNYSTVNLAWDAPAGPVASYNIYRKINNGAFELQDNITTNAFTQSDLTDATYTYHVVSVWEQDLMSIPSDEAAVKVSHIPVANLEVTNIETDGTATVNWGAPGSGGIVGFSDDFEAHDDFSIAFDPWTLTDVDRLRTYGIRNVIWENSHQPQAFIIFNGSATQPAVAADLAHSGAKFVACFASTPANNDWMITPRLFILEGDHVSFWAKAYNTDFAAEKFNVLVSTEGTDVANFTSISGNTPVTVASATEWTRYSYDLSAYVGQTVYTAIQCVSADQFIFMIDDFAVGANISANIATFNPNTSFANVYEKSLPTANNTSTVVTKKATTTRNTRSITGYKVYLNNEFVADVANDVTTYELTGLTGSNNYTVAVTAIYPDGQESQQITADFNTTGTNEQVTPVVTALAGNYPNPFNPTTTIRFSLKEKQNVKLTVYNILGQKVKTLVNGELEAKAEHKVIWNGDDKNGKKVASGIYFYRMKAARYTSTKKMILMK